MVAAHPHQAGRRAPAADQTGQAAEAPQATTTAEATEGEVMTGKFREALVLGLAQNVILAGLIILTAGVPTW